MPASNTVLPAVDHHTVYFGAIREKLQLAEHFFQTYRTILLSDPDVLRCFEKLQEEGQLLADQMEHLALGSLCTRCAGTPEGGCCSIQMAGEIDAIQILLNLLAGANIRQYDNGGECCFLGPAGCIFPFKPMFCLNYNCHRIHRACSTEEVARLEGAAARVLSRQYEIERLILDIFNRQKA